MAATAPLPSPPTRPSALRLLAEQSFSRAAGAPLLAGNGVDLLIDARAAFDAWLAAIRGAERSILFENYIFRDDALGREFVAALAERAAAGVRVCVVRDWLGCLGQSGPRLWAPLVAAGGEVRAYNPPRLASPFGWLSRDHRKLLVIDHAIGFVGGICVSGTWLGDAARGIEPWRDTAVAVRGPAVLELAHAFAEVWSQLGEPLPPDDAPAAALPSGQVDLRVVATVPNTAGLYRLDQLIAGMARRNLWLTDAYFVGVAPYVQALIAAARDGVDVRLLVPGSSDIPAVGSLSRAGYRPLLEAGIRVFEWNGSMLHAKTAVADGRWARVGSSNLNLASWIGNCEIDLAIEDDAFARRMEAQYEQDLARSTEIVLKMPKRRRASAERAPRNARAQGGSSGRAAAGALRLANSIGAAITNRRVLGPAECAPLLVAGISLLVAAVLALAWPRLVAWPLAVLATWIGIALVARYVDLRRRAPPRREDASGPPA
ncbi:phospholipase D-like domain-containing protein [Dokdonella fugitiva]|jgi:cardiolipin synthase|uniref:phospholipase D-like domain-containing protein n=1 Tax=Dokdonella fugitiva TaxID=328517 RepID=UPI0015F99F9F|nr:phospholipase D-like domain-containing protein [Dokdonella fugitiva]MBA8884854.1 cardiolipin synthase [Dokdonella fugitiva]